MTYFRFPEKPWIRAALGVFLLLMLYLARDTMFTASVLGFYRSQFLMLALMGGLALIFLIYNRRSWRAILTDRRMIAAAAATVVLLVPMIVKSDWQLMYFSILLCLYFAIFLSFFMTLQEVARYYVVILSVLGLYSVLTAYVLRLLPDQGLLSVPTFINGAGFEFYNFGLSSVPLTYVKNRNFGIFREPGVYQFFLLMGLYLTHYEISWERPRQMWLVTFILALTMLTTFATGGVAEMGLLFVVLFFDKKWYRDKRIRRLTLALIAAAAVIVAVSVAQKNALYWELYDMAYGKFFNQQDSFVERTEAIFVDIGLFLEHPLFGAELSQVLHAVENNTTSTLVLFAVFGIAGGLLHVLTWLALAWGKERRLWVRLALTGILFLSFNTQNITADVFFWLFPVLALVERGLPGLPHRKE